MSLIGRNATGLRVKTPPFTNNSTTSMLRRTCTVAVTGSSAIRTRYSRARRDMEKSFQHKGSVVCILSIAGVAFV